MAELDREAVGVEAAQRLHALVCERHHDLCLTPDPDGGDDWACLLEHEKEAWADLHAAFLADFSKQLLSDEAIEAAGHASRTFAPADPCAPQTWEATPASHKALIREAARLYIGAAIETAEAALKAATP